MDFGAGKVIGSARFEGCIGVACINSSINDINIPPTLFIFSFDYNICKVNSNNCLLRPLLSGPINFCPIDSAPSKTAHKLSNSNYLSKD